MSVHVKICGLGRPEDVAACVAAKVRYVGFTFFEKSPRYVTFVKARELALAVPPGLAKVALSVNADDATLEALLAEVPIDVLQLHGTESPDRVAEVKARFGLPVMKAVGISDEEDLPKIDEFSRVADQLLIDAKPPKGGALPGGNGLTFDWRLIAGRRFSVPWMLAGGLTSANVAEAVRRTGATQVDLSSGVESAPGVKDANLIHEFVAAAQGTANA